MSTSWEDWASKKAEIDPRTAIEGLLEIGLAYRVAQQDVKIPLRTRMRQLPEVLNMVRLAENGTSEDDIAPLMASAPEDLRFEIVSLRCALGVADISPDISQNAHIRHPGPLGYFINLDERGAFFADIRDEGGRSVFEVRSDDETGKIWLIEDGYMRHKSDLDGLHDHLEEIGLIDRHAELFPRNRFEALLDDTLCLEM